MSLCSIDHRRFGRVRIAGTREPEMMLLAVCRFDGQTWAQRGAKICQIVAPALETLFGELV
jgi:hypothetical protein